MPALGRKTRDSWGNVRLFFIVLNSMSNRDCMMFLFVWLVDDISTGSVHQPRRKTRQGRKSPERAVISKHRVKPGEKKLQSPGKP